VTLLAVIPARQGSKGIPGKALRTVGGVPLILRTLRTVEASGAASRIVISTDWPELREFCELRGYETLERPAELATDDAPLMPVAKHAVEALGWEGTVGIFQPTCPLLESHTIREALQEFEDDGWDWAITAQDSPHIYWRHGVPLIGRVNRQQLDEIQVESGAVQLMSAAHAVSCQADVDYSRCVTLPIEGHQALDIDNPEDLLLAEALVGLRHIHFVVASGHQIGTGHYHRSSHLARVLSHHELSWEWVGGPLDWMEGTPGPRQGVAADVTIFDRLEVPEHQLLKARLEGKVVVLEDEGAASGRLADLRVNELLDLDDLRFTVLREEFCALAERVHVEEGQRVLATFGGTDPAGLAARMARELPEATVVEPGASMARSMRDVDLIVTGQGRTVLEAAACGTPCISIAANEREARHVRIPGVTYLGLHTTVAPEALRHAVGQTLASVELRREMAQTARAAFDDRGADRLARAIEGLLV